MSTTPETLFHGRAIDGTPVEVWALTNAHSHQEEFFLTFGWTDILMKNRPTPELLSGLQAAFGIGS